jgi:hypothetical protein
MGNELQTIEILAKKFLNSAEYASFVDLLLAIDKRATKLLSVAQEGRPTTTEEVKDIKYPYDIEIAMNIVVFKNNQLGQRLDKVNTLDLSFLKKVNIGKEPSPYINELIGLVEQYCSK